MYRNFAVLISLLWMSFCVKVTLGIIPLQTTVLPQNRPNIVLIVTDDQDVTMGGLIPMEKTQKHISNKGTTFSNAFTSSPICCPSRASILTGLYAHNHGTLNNSVSGGCYSTHWRNHIEPHTIAVWLQGIGYETFFAGKYLNEYHSCKVPSGWNQWYGLDGNSKYYNYTLIENGQRQLYIDEYFTDILKKHTLNFLSNQTTRERPFFAMITPSAPHEPFTPADRHRDAFENVRVPQKENYNVPAGEFDKHWLLRMPPATLPAETLNHLDDIYRKRWQTLLAVDELVADVVDKLNELDKLNDTFIIFTSDNGYHLGQFAMAFDKRQPYESDIRVPFMVRGPGVGEKLVNNHPIVLIDIVPTIFDIVGISKPDYLDGMSFISHLDNSSSNDVSNNKNRQILIEYWGEGNQNTFNNECPWKMEDNLSLCLLESNCHCQDAWNNTYACNRYIGSDEDQIYCEFFDHESFLEAYDLTTDPFQLNNLGFTMLPSERAIKSLALAKLQTCSGFTCQKLY